MDLPPGAGNLLFGGDFFHGESYPGRLDRLARAGWDEGLVQLDLLLHAADGAVLNLEAPLTPPGPTRLSGRKPFVHWSHHEEVPPRLRTRRVAAVSLANNHVMDHGPAGLRRTLAALGDQGIVPFGAGCDAASAARPLLLAGRAGAQPFECLVFGGFQYHPGYDFLYRFYARGDQPGVSPLGPRLAHHLRTARQRHPRAFIVVFPHWGFDWGHETPDQRRTARHWIDAGADLVLGHGPHEVQGIERYRGRWIFHSLGSFMFQVPNPPTLPAGLAVRVGLQDPTQPRLQVIPLHGAGADGCAVPRPMTRDECQRFTSAPKWAELLAQGRPLDDAHLAGWEIG